MCAICRRISALHQKQKQYRTMGSHPLHSYSHNVGKRKYRIRYSVLSQKKPKKTPASGSPAASSYGPASTSIQSTFCRCVLVASCGGGRSSPRFGDERRTIVPPLFALCMSGQAAAGHYQRAALLQPDFAHCAQSPEHHHRPASCHGELLLRPLARLSRWHTLAICCSRSASSSPHSCHGAVATHLLAGLSHADSTSLPLCCTPRAATAAGSRPA